MKPWREVVSARLERASWPWDRTAWKWRIKLAECGHEVERKQGKGPAPKRIRCDFCPAKEGP